MHSGVSLTQVDGQGNDLGSQYRSAVYYTIDTQHAAIVASRRAYHRALQMSGVHRSIVTEVRPLCDATFYPAETYHQQYLAKPGARPYCSARPLMVQLPSGAPDVGLGQTVAEAEADRLPEAFWAEHAPSFHCALSLPDAPIVWAASGSSSAHNGAADHGDDGSNDDADDEPCPPPMDESFAMVRGGDDLMAPNAHGSAAAPVQQRLRWSCDRELADRICCFNRHFAEPRGHFELTGLLTWILERCATSPDGCQEACATSSSVSGSPALAFFDSVSGKRLFQLSSRTGARSPQAFVAESVTHGELLPRSHPHEVPCIEFRTSMATR